MWIKDGRGGGKRWKDNRGGRKTGKSGGRTRKVKGVEEEVGTGVEGG